MSRMDFVFDLHTGMEDIVIIEERNTLAWQELIKEETNETVCEFFDKIRNCRKPVIVVTPPPKKRFIPSEFNFYHEFSHPQEHAQVSEWEKNCNNCLSKSEIANLVKKYPLFLNEIGMAIQLAEKAALYSKGVHKFDRDDISYAINKLQLATDKEILFGGDRTIPSWRKMTSSQQTCAEKISI